MNSRSSANNSMIEEQHGCLVAASSLGLPVGSLLPWSRKPSCRSSFRQSNPRVIGQVSFSGKRGKASQLPCFLDHEVVGRAGGVLQAPLLKQNPLHFATKHDSKTLLSIWYQALGPTSSPRFRLPELGFHIHVHTHVLILKPLLAEEKPNLGICENSSDDQFMLHPGTSPSSEGSECSGRDFLLAFWESFSKILSCSLLPPRVTSIGLNFSTFEAWPNPMGHRSSHRTARSLIDCHVDGSHNRYSATASFSNPKNNKIQPFSLIEHLSLVSSLTVFSFPFAGDLIAILLLHHADCRHTKVQNLCRLSIRNTNNSSDEYVQAGVKPSACFAFLSNLACGLIQFVTNFRQSHHFSSVYVWCF